MAESAFRLKGKKAVVTGGDQGILQADADYVTGSTFFVDGGLTSNYSEQ